MADKKNKELEEALRRLEEAEKEFDRKWKEADRKGLFKEESRKA